MLDCTEFEKLHLLNTMVLTDTSYGSEIPIYPFTQTPDNTNSVLDRSIQLFEHNRRWNGTLPILLTDNLGGSEPGYPGAPTWQECLDRRSLCIKINTMLVPFKDPNLNTLTEAINLGHFMQERGWDRLVIVAPPFHQLRCFLSMLTAITTLNPPYIKVYNQVGLTQPWNEHVVHSQKTAKGTRKDLTLGEFRRILKYQKEGTPVPLISTESALAYLEWRDGYSPDFTRISMVHL